MLDVKKIREQFPVLKNNPDLVYLDSGATTLKPQSVIDAMNYYYEHISSSVHRGVYKLSYESTKMYSDARDNIARFINAESSAQVVFTRGTTAALNLVMQGYAREQLKPGDEVIISELEHHSNYIPWQQVCKKTGAKLVLVPLTKEGYVTVPNLRKVINGNTKIVALHHVSNTIGDIVPIKEIAALVHEHNAILVVDGAQSTPHMKIDVQDLGCDFFAFSGHKMCGPTGIGVLYGKMELLKIMEPVEFGGDMNDAVTYEETSFKNPPVKFEAGTPLIAEVIGLSAAVDFLESIGLDNIRRHEQELKAYTNERMSELDNVDYFNPHTDTGLITFNVKDVHSHDATSLYDQENVAVRAGHHCAQPAMKFLNINNCLRASLYLYNTKEDIDAFIEVTKKGEDFLDVFFI